MKNQTNDKGQFVKGMVPWNAGLRGTYSLPNENETSFKSGKQHPRYRPIGSERIEKGDYIVIKVGERKWMKKHRYVWERENGPVPNGHVVIFANGNKQDFRPENLILVSRGQLAMLNKEKLIAEDADLTKVGVTLVDLRLKINEVQRRDR